jgi:glycosyltransferase involved in cell wall biosynthesis
VLIDDPRPLAGLCICYFGRFDPTYARNVITARCLQRAGARVIQIRDDRGLAARTPSLLRRLLTTPCDAIVVGFRAHADMPAARFAARRKGVPLIFDPLTSRYEEKVVDRRLVGPHTMLARWYRATDRYGCRAADRILLETDAQAAFFAETFGVPRDRFRRLWLGANEEVMRPAPGVVRAASAPFTVFFYGRFSPLHGVEHIVDAAAQLERAGREVRFVLVGAGQTYDTVRARATSLGVTRVEFPGVVPYAQLPSMMAGADLCLGSFGTTARAQRVIPNKVFDALAVGRPVLTADTPGAREALTHGANAWLVQPGSGAAIADAIVTLERDRAQLARIGDAGHALFAERFSFDALTRDLTAVVRELVDARSPRQNAGPATRTR